MTGDPEIFEQQWPALERQLHRALAFRKLRASDREDIVQETALRLVGMWGRVDKDRPVWPLALTIALNLMKDETRRKRGHELTFGDLIDRPSGADVERAGLARLELSRVARAMTHLKPSHRSVLLEEVAADPSETGPTSATNRMARMRARRKLTSLLEAASMTIWLLAMRVRRGLESVSPSTIGAVAAVAVIATAAPGPLIHDQSPAQSTRESIPTARGPAQVDSGPMDSSSRSEVVAAPVAVEVTRPVDGDPASRPVQVPLGNGNAEASGSIQINDARVELTDQGGPVPACVGGVSGVPQQLECQD